jgi:hypothetical protein
MRVFGHLLLATAVLAACDPIRVISVSRDLAELPDRECVVSALRASELVRRVGVSDQGTLFAELVIPADISPPYPDRPTQLVVEEARTAHGSTELILRVLWVGRKGSPEYHRYVQESLSKLQRATLRACAASGT